MFLATSEINYLDKYLNNTLSKIYTSQDLCKLLYYDVPNPLEQPNLVDTKSLFYDVNNKKIFTTPFTVDIADIQKTTLTININESDVEDVFYKNIKIDFYVLSHVHLWELGTSDISSTSLRPNLIVHELAKLFNREQNIGIGKNHYSYMKRFQPNQFYSGYIYCLSGMDFVLNN